MARLLVAMEAANLHPVESPRLPPESPEWGTPAIDLDREGIPCPIGRELLLGQAHPSFVTRLVWGGRPC
jgi:hypothetical protein